MTLSLAKRRNLLANYVLCSLATHRSVGISTCHEIFTYSDRWVSAIYHGEQLITFFSDEEQGINQILEREREKLP